jgi:tripartite-type tricarboxylate transporter receptor subunit TctC
VKDSEVYAVQGILGPAGLPAPTVARLNAELNNSFQTAAVQKRFADIGMEALPGTPAQFLALARAESRRWGAVIRAAGIRLD